MYLKNEKIETNHTEVECTPHQRKVTSFLTSLRRSIVTPQANREKNRFSCGKKSFSPTAVDAVQNI